MTKNQPCPDCGTLMEKSAFWWGMNFREQWICRGCGQTWSEQQIKLVYDLMSKVDSQEGNAVDSESGCEAYEHLYYEDREDREWDYEYYEEDYVYDEGPLPFWRQSLAWNWAHWTYKTYWFFWRRFKRCPDCKKRRINCHCPPF